MVFAATKKTDLISVSGYITMKGNVPFEYPCIKTEDGLEYAVHGTKKQIEAINKTQGNEIYIDGVLVENKEGEVAFQSAENGIIELKKWHFVK